MKLQSVPAREGVRWVRRGFAVFFKQPMAFAGMFAAFYFTFFLLTLLPLVGPVLQLALLPLGSLGFMAATQVALGGKFPTPRLFIEPLRGPRPQAMALVKLGLGYAAAVFLLTYLIDWVDGGALDALMSSFYDGNTSQEVFAARLADSRTAILMLFGAFGLLAVPFWHAPALIRWAGQGCAQALFSSTLACWRNKGAFAVYSLTWVAVVLFFGLAANLVFALIGQIQLVAVAAMPASLIFATVFYASLYFTFVGSFVQDDPVLLETADNPGPA